MNRKVCSFVFGCLLAIVVLQSVATVAQFRMMLSVSTRHLDLMGSGFSDLDAATSDGMRLHSSVRRFALADETTVVFACEISATSTPVYFKLGHALFPTRLRPYVGSIDRLGEALKEYRLTGPVLILDFGSRMQADSAQSLELLVREPFFQLFRVPAGSGQR